MAVVFHSIFIVLVLFQGCTDAWNKTKFCFVSADHRQHF